MYRVIQMFLLIFIVPVYLLAQISQLHLAGKPERIAIPIPEVRDINGRICDVIHIIADMEGFNYDSYQGIVKMIDLKGLDIIFLSPDERVLEIYHSGYQPLKIILSDIGIRLASNQGWKITLSAEKIVSQVPVIINTYPDSVAVTIDDIDYGEGKLFMLADGKHKIQLSKKDFTTLIDSIIVDQNNSQFKFVLAPQVDMVFVEGGTFQMGDTFGYNMADEKPVHNVKLKDFYMSKYEIAFAAYDAFCEETSKAKPDDKNWGRNRRPVIHVSWYGAVEFCNWLSQKNGLSECYQIDKSHPDPNNESKDDALKWTVTRNVNANGYRLPTEAEWEYAAKGGRKSKGYKYSGSNIVNEVAWFHSNSGYETYPGYRTYPLGSKQPNELGLYDMNGNVSEWCADWYDENYYYKSAKENPSGPSGGTFRVLRGGSYYDYERDMRCANRDYSYQSFITRFQGFRCVR